LRGGLNKQLEKEGVLLSTSSPRNTAIHELSTLHHQVEEDIIYRDVDTNGIQVSHRPDGERGRWQPRIVSHEKLNAKLQSLQDNETCHLIRNLEMLNACIKENDT
jgi:hypothetical protein